MTSKLSSKLFSSKLAILSLAILSVFSLALGGIFLFSNGSLVANAANNETFSAGDKVRVANISNSTLNVRVNSTCGKVFSSVKNGATATVKSVGATNVTCNGFTGRFVKVAFNNGPEGFVASNFITKSASTPATPGVSQKVKVNVYAGNLNVRATSCGNILTGVKTGTIGTVQTDSANGTKASCNGSTWTFVKVKFDNGPTGFVAQELLNNI